MRWRPWGIKGRVYGTLSRRARLQMYTEMRDDLEAENEQQLADEVDQRRVYGQRVHVRVQLPFPQDVRERASQPKRCDDLRKWHCLSVVLAGKARTLTAIQKNSSENRRNIIGTCSQPRARKVARKAISIGTVTQRSVIMTRRGDGGWISGG